ncbi:MAG: DUF4173 domain-containing protein [Pyrinomonadaceae bacterium]
MNEKTKTALKILQASVLLGILWDILVKDSLSGLNIFVWFTLLAAAMIAIVWRKDPEKITSQTLLLHAAVIFFAFTFTIRDSAELKALSILAILSILAVQTVSALRLRTEISGVVHYFVGAIWTGLNAAFGSFALITADIEWNFLKKTGISKHLISVIKGIAIAVPLLFVFGGLFAAADAVFEGLVDDVFQLNPALVGHVIVIGVISWFTAGYLRASMIGIDNFAKEPSPNKDSISINPETGGDAAETEEAGPEALAEKKSFDLQNLDNSYLPEMFRLGTVEIAVVLGLINMLFLVFVIIQIPYLFGGMQLIQTTPDFKLAEYARRGFGELIAVAALVLPILLGTHWLLRREEPAAEKLFRTLAAVQIGLLFVIMISAAQRLLLLSGNLGYGLTAGRLYPIAFIVFLAMIFIWFGATVLRGMRGRFAWGALWCGLFVLATLHVLNPDDFIVRTNLRLMEQGRPFDAEYNAGLSSDAVPALLGSANLMNSQNGERVMKRLYLRHCILSKKEDIRSWNWSRKRAQTILGISPAFTANKCAEGSSRSGQ